MNGLLVALAIGVLALGVAMLFAAGAILRNSLREYRFDPDAAFRRRIDELLSLRRRAREAGIKPDDPNYPVLGDIP